MTRTEPADARARRNHRSGRSSAVPFVIERPCTPGSLPVAQLGISQVAYDNSRSSARTRQRYGRDTRHETTFGYPWPRRRTGLGIAVARTAVDYQSIPGRVRGLHVT